MKVKNVTTIFGVEKTICVPDFKKLHEIDEYRVSMGIREKKALLGSSLDNPYFPPERRPIDIASLKSPRNRSLSRTRSLRRSNDPLAKIQLLEIDDGRSDCSTHNQDENVEPKTIAEAAGLKESFSCCETQSSSVLTLDQTLDSGYWTSDADENDLETLGHADASSFGVTLGVFTTETQASSDLSLDRTLDSGYWSSAANGYEGLDLSSAALSTAVERSDQSSYGLESDGDRLSTTTALNAESFGFYSDVSDVDDDMHFNEHVILRRVTLQELNSKKEEPNDLKSALNLMFQAYDIPLID